MKKIILVAAIFIFCFKATAFCQAGNDVVTNAVSNLKTSLTDHMAEKAFLHFDRPYPYYVAGEIVYFKAYVVMGEKHEASTISGVLHVDLIDKNDILMKSIALQLTNGTGWGDFALPDTLSKGSYRIRAYTDWMRNDKVPYFFDQYFSVSSMNSIDRVADNNQPGKKADLQFFPEGGSFVGDIPSKVAFKAIGSNGEGINVKGIIVDNDHKEVAKINSAHLGMGAVSFVPETGKTYKAMVTFADGSQGVVDLPAVEAKGITLSVNTADPSKVSIEMKANRAYYKDNQNKTLNLLIYYAGALKRYTPKLDNGLLGLDLPASTFPTGIVKISLLSETGEPIDERLVFIQNPDLLKLGLNTNKQEYNTRDNVQINLNAKDKDGKPVNGSFSVSVIDESKILADDNAENTILSNLLLTSEIKGYVEKPNYYFANVSKQSRADLDVLMLTQGYRHFEWKAVENESPATGNAFMPEKSIDISGELKTRSGDPIPNCTLTLIAQAGGSTQIQTTDSQGKFRFPNAEGAKYILKATSSAGKKGILTLDKSGREPLITVDNTTDAKYNQNADILALLQNQKTGAETASYTSTTTLISKDDKAFFPKRNDNYRSSNYGGAGHADQVVLGDAVKNSPVLSTGLNGLLLGVRFDHGIPALITGAVVTPAGSEIEPMLVVVDGLNLGRGIDIDIVNPVSVESVEVLKSANAAIYGVDGGEGVLIITTRQRNENTEIISREMSPGIFSIEPQGLFKAREFYSPVYTSKNSNNKPDMRTTIFWKPDVITDQFGNADFGFFNSDGKGSYRVEVEGMDNKGNLGMQVFRYKVD